MTKIGQQVTGISGQNSSQRDDVNAKIQIPQFLTHALQDENTLKEMILPPESLLNNLLDGIEEAPVEDEESSEDDILKNSNEKELRIEQKRVNCCD